MNMMMLLPRWVKHRFTKIKPTDVADDIECSRLINMPFVARFILATVYEMYFWLLLLVIGYVASVCFIVEESNLLNMNAFRHSWWITSFLASLSTAISMGTYTNNADGKSKLQIALCLLFSLVLALYVVLGADIPATHSILHPITKGIYLWPYLIVCVVYVAAAVSMWVLVFQTQSFCSLWMQVTSATQDNLALAMNVVFMISIIQLLFPSAWSSFELDLDWYTGYFIYPMLLVTDTMAILNDKRKYMTLSALSYAIQIQLDLIHVSSHLSYFMSY